MAIACKGCAATDDPESAFQKISLQKFQDNTFQIIGDEWLLVTPSSRIDDFNVMTASWGIVGDYIDEKVVFIFVRPQNNTYALMQESDFFTLSVFEKKQHSILQFYEILSERKSGKTAETGLRPMFKEIGNRYYERAKLVIECEKIFSEYLIEDSYFVKTTIEKMIKTKGFSKLYVGKILNVWERTNED
jgi:flavin reductase (DIM6/NTAB) family NADH-FMN oxidoreductase RutF